MNQNLATYARNLRLSFLLSSLELRLEKARTHQLPHDHFLELIFQDELNVRQQRMIDKRTKDAGFRDQKTLRTSIRRSTLRSSASKSTNWLPTVPIIESARTCVGQ